MCLLKVSLFIPGLSVPENVRVAERSCGQKHVVSISWKVCNLCYEVKCFLKFQQSEKVALNTTISWRGVHSSGATHYERGSSEDSHLLTLDYSETGPVEIAVTFSSAVCNKTTVTHYLGKTVFLSCGVCHSLHIYSAVEGVLTSVSLRSRTLVIESRDCIASPENYRIVVTSTDTPSTELVNVSFSPTIEHDVGDVVRPNTQYTITVVLVETTSNTIVEERNEVIIIIVPPSGES